MHSNCYIVLFPIALLHVHHFESPMLLASYHHDSFQFKLTQLQVASGNIHPMQARVRDMHVCVWVCQFQFHVKRGIEKAVFQQVSVSVYSVPA